jgi:uncharacterized RDD family membrane protein YckC
MQWYYANGNSRQGPVSEEEFQRLAAEGIVHADTLVWRQGMVNWAPFSQVAPNLPPPLIPAATSPAPGSEGAPATAGGISPASDAPVRQSAAYAGGVIGHEHLRYAGFWIRFVAKLIDIAILVGFSLLLARFFGGNSVSLALLDPNDPAMVMNFLMHELTLLLVNIVIALAYDWFFLAKYEATPGKLLFGLKVVRSDGSKLTTGRIIGRHFAEFINGLILYIGYVIAAFDDEKRALHDHICDTRVIHWR